MRPAVTRAAVRELLRRLAASLTERATVHLWGGATAVLMGWRDRTVALELVLDGEDDALLRRMAALRDELHVNVERVSVPTFLPLTDGWPARSPLAQRDDLLEVRHVDLVAQALARIERGHELDLADLDAMFDRDLVTGSELLAALALVEVELWRWPDVHGPSFRAAVEAAVERYDPGATDSATT